MNTYNINGFPTGVSQIGDLYAHTNGIITEPDASLPTAYPINSDYQITPTQKIMPIHSADALLNPRDSLILSTGTFAESTQQVFPTNSAYSAKFQRLKFDWKLAGNVHMREIFVTIPCTFTWNNVRFPSIQNMFPPYALLQMFQKTRLYVGNGTRVPLLLGDNHDILKRAIYLCNRKCTLIERMQMQVAGLPWLSLIHI